MTEPEQYTDNDPSRDAAAAQALIQQALASRPPVEEKPLPKMRPASDTDVTLPGGIRTIDGDVVTTAEVRELNGADEEFIGRTKSLPKFVAAILERGVVAVGDSKPTKDTFDKMLAGDLDTLLIQISIATFGAEVEFSSITCSGCDHTEEDATVDLREVPIRSLEDPDDGEFLLDLDSGKSVLVSLPDGATQKALAASQDRTEAVLKTLLLSNCVQEINGMPVAGADAVRNLSVKDRKALIEEIEKRNPGPRLLEVSRSCTECGEKIELPLGLTDLFRF